MYVVHFTQAAGARTRAGADQHQRLHPRGEGPDRRADRRLPVQPRLRQDAVAAGAARHRRAPRRHAAEVPPPRRAARPGRAAQGHLRHRHARRRHQRADPDGGVHRPDQVRRAPAADAQGARVPPDRRAGGTGRLRHRRHRRRPGAGARGRERQAGGEGRRRPEEAQRRVQRKKAPEGFVTWTEETFDRLVAAEPEPLVVPDAGHPLDAAQRDRAAGRPGRRDAAAAARQPRGAARAAAADAARRRAAPVAAGGRRGGAGRPARTRTAGGCGWSTTCSSTSRSNQPLSAFALAALDTARPGVADVRARRGLGHRGDARGPATGAGGPGAPRARRGGRRR